MARADPRLQKVERLMIEAMRLLAEIKAGVPPPRAKPKRRHRYQLPKILAALREGAPLEAKPGERDPRLPSRNVFAKYRRANPRFDREATALLKERSLKACRRKGRVAPTPGATNWAERLPGQKYDWEAIAAKIEAGATVGPYSPNRQGLPSHTLIMKRRKADPVFGARVAHVLAGRFGTGRRIPVDRETVLERIREGAVIKAWPPERGMPRKDQIDRLRREDGTFNSAVREAIVEARRRKSNRRKLSKLPRNAAWVAAQSAVPRSLHPEVREDLIGELSVLICSGQVEVDGDLATAWRKCRTRLTGHRWKETSLDAPLNGTDDLRRIDLLDDEVVRF